MNKNLKKITSTKIDGGKGSKSAPKSSKKNSRNSMKPSIKVTISLFSVIVLMAICAILAYNILWKPNINCDTKRYRNLYIHSGATWSSVKDTLMSMQLIKNEAEFDRALKFFIDAETPHCGYYSLEPNITNRAFINRVAYGLSNKVPMEVKMTRYTRWVARNLSRQLDVDSAQLYHTFVADTTLRKFGLTEESSMVMFVRFRRDVCWCSSAADVMNVVEEEYNKFWNVDRLAKCNEVGLTPVQVTILASIVEEETNNYDDRRMVAGVYINRLHKGMPLQACPTARYASGDFSLNRILKVHTQIDSPYNTYIYQGLPPGPIRIPSENSIDAVLNYEHHNYLYMCAKSDFSGTHDFSTTYQQHSQNAHKYQRELNKRGKKNLN